MLDPSSPLKIPMFRKAWASSILTNVALLVQGVGVTWIMVEIGSSDSLVAWVQAATSLPLMLLSVPAGAIADVFNRRKVALLGLLIAFSGSAILLSATYLGELTPWTLLGLCFLTGAGVALYDPSWQASVPRLVPLEQLPQAIALRSISQNLARALGPAIGGGLVAWFGGIAAFVCASALYLPLMFVLYRWNYQHETPRLPPERIAGAVQAGFRFVWNAPSIRTSVIRGFVSGTLGVGILALMPLTAKYLLGGTAADYGIILGGFGFGAVLGGASISTARRKSTTEKIITYATITIGLSAVLMSQISHVVPMTVVTCLAGVAWMMIFSNINIKVQSLAPRWVMGRVLATYGAATTGGMVLGSILWGKLVDQLGIVDSLQIIGICNLAGSLIGIWLRIPDRNVIARDISGVDPDIALALKVTHRSGPIEVNNEYRIDPENARVFYRRMQAVKRLRKRNGSYDWSISRDVSDAWVWIERYRLSTWLDFLRMNGRTTSRDLEILANAQQFQHEGEDIKMRVRLVRPMGSVRWREEVVDTPSHDVNY